MEEQKEHKKWERTNVTNLLRNRESGKYYARVRVAGKQKWRTLKTTVFTVAKARLGDVEKKLQAQSAAAKGKGSAHSHEETSVRRFIETFEARVGQDTRLSAATKARTLNSVKTLVKTWADLPARDIRRLTAADCRDWAAYALKTGTGFVAPNAKTTRKGMSPSSFNKCVDVLRRILEVAREQGYLYDNPATAVSKVAPRKRELDLPSPQQLRAVVERISTAGSRWSRDAADLAQLLAYSGARLREGTRVRWYHVDDAQNLITIPGTKTEGSYRTIPLFPSLRKLLQSIRERRGPESAGAPIAKVGGCLQALRNACKSLGLHPMTHHDLRHYFATVAIESGVDIPTVSRWLGHKDGGALAMKTYGHLRQEHSQRQAEKVHG